MPTLIQGDARCLPLADSSVDLIVTSPPYYLLRSYSDHGEHYEGQIGSEPTPQAYLDNLIECTREMMRVLKSSGSIWLNLGDKYCGYSGKNWGHGRTLGTDVRSNSRVPITGPVSAPTLYGVPNKSLMLLPHRYAIRCIDELGLIVRQDQVWAKKSALPESVVDRTRRSHEYLFHMVKSPRYYSAVDEIREPASDYSRPGLNGRKARGGQKARAMLDTCNPLGKLPGSVWSTPSQPLNVPDHISHVRCCDGRKRDGCEAGLGHYAAFPMALVRPIILGWSPREVCTACGEGRRLIVDTKLTVDRGGRKANVRGADREGAAIYEPSSSLGRERVVTITSTACKCLDTTASITPGVVLDPFGGTGSAVLVAAMNGRTGISLDASWDYSDIIARWRIHDPKERARAAGLDPDAVARIKPVAPTQGSLWDDIGGGAAYTHGHVRT